LWAKNILIYSAVTGETHRE